MGLVASVVAFVDPPLVSLHLMLMANNSSPSASQLANPHPVGPLSVYM